MKCPKCDQQSDDYEPGSDMNFCEYCGAPLDEKSDRFIDREVEKMASEQKPKCTCPLPYQAKKPEEHEESCPVVATSIQKSEKGKAGVS